MKKSTKKMLIQIGVAAGLLAVLLVIFLLALKPGETRKDKWGKIAFFEGIQKDKIEGIQIEMTRNGITFQTIINKISNEWVILSPFMVRADPFAIDKLLDDLLLIASEGMLTNVSSERLSEYGFDEPSSAVFFGLNDGTSHSLINGRLAPTENYYYTIHDQRTNDVYFTFAYKFSSVEKTPGELANKQLFDDQLQPIPSVTNIQMNNSAGEFYAFGRVSNAGGIYWEMTSPRRMKVDEYSLRRKQLEIFAVSANTYAAYDQSPDTLRFFELDRPRYHVRIASDNGAVSDLYIGGLSVSNFVFGYSTAKPGVFQIYESDIVEPFKFSVNDFMPVEVQQ